MSEHEHPALHEPSCGGNAAPYVLGALTDEEHEAFVVHLRSCAVCREEVKSLQAVAAALPGVAPHVHAPRGIKRRVMSEVRADARRRRAVEQGARARPARRLAGAIAVAAAVALAVVLATGGSGTTRVIRAQVSAPGARGALQVRSGRALLSLSGMPQAGRGRVYEVWLERAGVPQPTDALFAVTASGSATVAVPGSLAGVREVLVTSEPSGGSAHPTRAPAVVARLS